MITAKLTELISIEVLSATTDNGGVVQESYLPFKTLFVSILNDQQNSNNENGSTKFDNGLQYVNRVRFYSRYLPDITLNNRLKKQYKVVHNGNEYYIDNLVTIAGRQATIIECSSTS